MKSIRDILKGRKLQQKYITREFQHYGYRLAEGLDDLKHKSLYIKLAKNEQRELLQKAWDFVKDSRAKSKGRLFMWKLKQLRQELKTQKSNLPAGRQVSKSATLAPFGRANSKTQNYSCQSVMRVLRFR